MKSLTSIACLASLLFVGACQSGPSSDYPAAQQVVSDIAASHDDIVRLSLHAHPEGKEGVMCIASTSAEKAGKPSDDEDVKALAEGEVVEMMEGENYDYTAPIKDHNGAVFAVVGVTVSGGDSASMKAMAEEIAHEVARAVNTSPNPLW